MEVDARPTRILLADARSVFREAVRNVLDREPDLWVVSEVGDGLDVIAEADRTRPDIAVLDASLPSRDGVSATRAIRDRVPECKVLLLADEGDHEDLVQAFEAGASGYLTKDCGLQELIETVRAVRRGETIVPPPMLGGLLGLLMRRRRDEGEALRQLARLTRREREILALLADGADNVSIARSLVISPQTVRTHMQHILRKLDVNSRLEAAAFARQYDVVRELQRPDSDVVAGEPDVEGGAVLFAVDSPA